MGQSGARAALAALLLVLACAGCSAPADARRSLSRVDDGEHTLDIYGDVAGLPKAHRFGQVRLRTSFARLPETCDPYCICARAALHAASRSACESQRH